MIDIITVLLGFQLYGGDINIEVPSSHIARSDNTNEGIPQTRKRFNKRQSHQNQRKSSMYKSIYYTVYLIFICESQHALKRVNKDWSSDNLSKCPGG